MRLGVVWTLFAKEVKETVRDRRTLLIMILMPMVLYPTFGLISSQAQFAQSSRLRTSRFRIGVRGGKLPVALARLIQEKIKKPLAEEVLFGRLSKGGEVRLRFEEGELQFEYTSKAMAKV